MENERRQFTRFLVPENVYAALTRKRCGVRFYRITDELRKRFEGFHICHLACAMGDFSGQTIV